MELNRIKVEITHLKLNKIKYDGTESNKTGDHSFKIK